MENEPLIIVLRADGNPMSITYTWTKDGLPITQSSYSNSSKCIDVKNNNYIKIVIIKNHNKIETLFADERILSEGSMLNITKLSRHDAGVYTCEAVNSQGAAIINITISVHCKYKNNSKHDKESIIINIYKYIT